MQAQQPDIGLTFHFTFAYCNESLALRSDTVHCSMIAGPLALLWLLRPYKSGCNYVGPKTG